MRLPPPALRRYVLPALVALALGPAAAGAQVRPGPSLGEIARESARMDQARERPPITGAWVAGQVFTGVFGGAVGAAAVGFGYYYGIERGTDEWAGLGAIVLAGIFGYPLGASAGVYLISTREEQTGSPWATLAGAAAGAVAGGLLAPLTDGLSYVALVPVGAAAGFNLTRRYRDPPSSSGAPAP